MPQTAPVIPEVFKAIQDVDILHLSTFNERDLRPLLPCLVRMSLCAPLDTSEAWTQQRRKVLQILSGIDAVNSLVGLLSIDFHALEQDAKKEQQLRLKAGGVQTESVLISQLQHGLALEFERSDAARKLRLLLSELLFIMSQVKEPKPEFFQKQSELFESEVYLEEVADVLCIAQAELPGLLPMTQVAEALLHVKNGAWLLCRLVANVPDSFTEVCSNLVANGEKQDEDLPGGRRRTKALRMLCKMNPSQALMVRSLCVSYCKLPGLAVALTLRHDGDESGTSSDSGISDLVLFISGLLLGHDLNVRNWFATFVKNGQKRKRESGTSMLHTLREQLLEELGSILPRDSMLKEQQAVQACAYIRLYCAFKGIAGLKSTEEEVKLLVRLIICHPPPTVTGMRFVSLGLAMLLACPYLISNIEQEKQASSWIRWLVKEEAYFEKTSGVAASHSEMLLLIAIHFHSNQNHAIAELVCSTLGMKISVKGGPLARLKTIFTQEIFTEQIVTAHAVRVPVTPNLSADIAGYLPIHCIYQLLKSRAFSKHKVPIKDWIYRQICSSTSPIHSLLPPLIEVFVNSIIMPSTKTDHVNEPITEQEILAVFQNSFLKTAGDGEDVMEVDGEGAVSFTSQLLLLYYVLLYQDCLLTNMKNIVASNRKVSRYSQNLMSQLPMKYLFQQAQKEQQHYAGLISPLLKLVSTHYPHLCLVEDWLDEEMSALTEAIQGGTQLRCLPSTPQNLQQAFSNVISCPSKLLLHLEQLLSLPASDLVQYSDILIQNLPKLLSGGIPRKVQEMTKKVWMKLNTVMPRQLRVKTVNALRPIIPGSFRMPPHNEDDITMDPLIVLRCDDAVFRCPPILEIQLRILNSYLQASRAFLSAHIQANPIVEKGGQMSSIQDREELKYALISAQESAAVQVLLEACLPKAEEKGDKSLLNDLREAQCLVCSQIHQLFIADPNLAKLVHFQGYPSELLPVTVQGIPSMHICLDFIPELLSQPHLEKQMFAVELVSYLCLQYALPKSLSIAKLAINVLATLVGVLSSDVRPDFFMPCLPAILRICQAFPPLCEDAITLLIQLGRVCTSHMSAEGNAICSDPLPVTDSFSSSKKQSSSKSLGLNSLPRYAELSNAIQKTFADIVQSAAVTKSIYC